MPILIVYLVVAPATAHAYIDPSTGSIALQAAIGVALAALFTLKTYWRKLMSLIGRRGAGRS